MTKTKGIVLISFIASLLLFKVYISNSIYLTSRDIQKIRTKINALKEEQSIIKLKIEKLKYQNEISDPLFSYDVYENKENIPKTQPKPKKEEKKQNPNSLFDDLNVDTLEGY